jgi:hypothetical protein
MIMIIQATEGSDFLFKASVLPPVSYRGISFMHRTDVSSVSRHDVTVRIDRILNHGVLFSEHP